MARKQSAARWRRRAPAPAQLRRGHGYRLRPAITTDEAVASLPALQGAQVNAGRLAGGLEPRARRMRNVDVSGQCLAIFEADHAASPLLKIAATFFDRTSRAAVSASTRSLRSSSRSSSLIRFLSCRVACGLARASSGSVRAIAFTLEERGRAMRPDILGVDLRFFGGSANCAWDTEYLGVATQGRTCAG